MRRWKFVPALLFCAASVSLAGCEGVFDRFAFTKSGAHQQGVEPLIAKEPFERINLVSILNPDAELGDILVKEVDDDAKNKANNEIKLGKAFKVFYRNVTDNLRRRNRVQERILAASNQRCGEYKKFLKQLDAETNFLLGSLTTALAGAGAIFTAASTVRALSGSASIISGVRAEFNTDYFANQTIQVLTTGFEVKRRRLYKAMVNRRRNGLTTYPVEAAIKDAVEYHMNCTLIAGLEETALSIRRVENPGIKGAQQALLETRRLIAIQDAPIEDLFSGGLMQEDLLSGLSFVTDGEIDEGTNSPLSAYSVAVNRVRTLAKKFSDEIIALKDDKAFKDSANALDTLNTKAQSAKTETVALLTKKTKEKAKDEDKKLRELQMAVVEETDRTKRQEANEAFRKQVLEGRKIIVEINTILSLFQIDIRAARKDMEDTDKPDVGARITAAQTRIDNLNKYMKEKQPSGGGTPPVERQETP